MSSTIASAIAQASTQSATFRTLSHALCGTDGIVYFENGGCGGAARACLLTVTPSGPNRILRIRVDARSVDWDLMGSIGHELQHAIEVLGDPAVTTTARMFFFYSREGTRRGRVFETAAAIRAGERVRTEARRHGSAGPNLRSSAARP